MSTTRTTSSTRTSRASSRTNAKPEPVAEPVAEVKAEPVAEPVGEITNNPDVFRPPIADEMNGEVFPNERAMIAAVNKHPGKKAREICEAEGWDCEMILASGKSLKMTLAGIIAGAKRQTNGTSKTNPATDSIAFPIADANVLLLLLSKTDSDMTIVRHAGELVAYLDPKAVASIIGATLGK